MKAIHSKVNIVPVIAKADTLTLRERDRLKRRVSVLHAHARAPSRAHPFDPQPATCVLCVNLPPKFFFFWLQEYSQEVWRTLDYRMSTQCYDPCVQLSG